MTEYTPAPTPAHPFEKFPGATRRVILPLSGVEVVVRRVDVEAVTSGCVLHAFRTGVLQDVAQEWARQSAEDTQDPTQPRRPAPELGMEDGLKLSRAIEVGILRNAVLAPPFDDLMALYGGSEAADDLGFGPDYSVLIGAANELNPPKAGEVERAAARMFPVPAGRDAGEPGGEVREAAE